MSGDKVETFSSFEPLESVTLSSRGSLTVKLGLKKMWVISGPGYKISLCGQFTLGELPSYTSYSCFPVRYLNVCPTYRLNPQKCYFSASNLDWWPWQQLRLLPPIRPLWEPVTDELSSQSGWSDLSADTHSELTLGKPSLAVSTQSAALWSVVYMRAFQKPHDA